MIPLLFFLAISIATDAFEAKADPILRREFAEAMAEAPDEPLRFILHARRLIDEDRQMLSDVGASVHSVARTTATVQAPARVLPKIAEFPFVLRMEGSRSLRFKSESHFR